MIALSFSYVVRSCVITSFLSVIVKGLVEYLHFFRQFHKEGLCAWMLLYPCFEGDTMAISLFSCEEKELVWLHLFFLL